MGTGMNIGYSLGVSESDDDSDGSDGSDGSESSEISDGSDGLEESGSFNVSGRSSQDVGRVLRGG